MSIAQLHILQPMPLLRKRTKRLGEDDPRRSGDRQLAATGAENLSRDSEEITDVAVTEPSVSLLAASVERGMHLHLTGAVAQIEECSTPHLAQGNKAASNGHRFSAALFGDER